MQDYIETAKDHVGYTILKDFQVAAVEACLSGNDVFLSQQTGMGKSAIYELFPFAKDQQLIQDGKLQGPLNARKPFSSVLIISPLIALMEDQVTSLSNRGLAAVQPFSLKGDLQMITKRLFDTGMENWLNLEHS